MMPGNAKLGITLLLMPFAGAIRILHDEPNEEANEQPLYDAREYQDLIARKSSHGKVGEAKTICIKGKSVPVFFLWGQKAGSTSVAASLAQSDVVWHGPKELDRFIQTKDSLYQWLPYKKAYYPPERVFNQDLQTCVDSWVNSGLFHDCYGGTDERGAVADMSPSLFSAQNITELLSHFYGPRAKDLVFLLTLREPLARLHSAYHFLRQPKRAGRYPLFHGEEYRSSFPDFIQASVDQLKRGHFSDGLQNSLYGKNLERFLKAGFNPSQFIIVPIKNYHADVNAVVAVTAKKLGMHFNSTHQLEPNHANKNGQSSETLANDLELSKQAGKQSVLAELEQIFHDDLQTLAKQLAAVHTEGINLVGYTGATGNFDDIKRWLQENW